MPKVKHLFLENNAEAKRLAITDIHGCSETFSALLEQLRLKKKDQIFILGDAVNRGPHSSKVLDKMIELERKGYTLFFIRGNHEQIVLKSRKKEEDERRQILNSYHSMDLLKNGQIKTKYLDLLKSSVHYIELDLFFLVHGGFNHRLENPFGDANSMMNTKRFNANKKYLKNKKVITGHSPKSLATIIEHIRLNNANVCIDNGCVNKVKGQGNLICMDLDAEFLYVQKNIE